MEIIPVKSWKAEFAKSAESEHFRTTLRRANEEARKREAEEEKAEREQDQLIDEAIMVTALEVTEFNITLDRYDTASYEALIENEHELDAVNAARETMLAKAFQLPDGRKAFESEDGLRVFDANGVELDPSVVTPEEIEDWRPKYEAYADVAKRAADLTEERAAIIEYQQRIADARELVKDGKISESDLNDIRQDLAEKMPDRVRAHLPEALRPGQEADGPLAEPATVQTTFRPGVKLDMPDI